MTSFKAALPMRLAHAADTRRGAAALVTILLCSLVLLMLVSGLTGVATMQTRDRMRYELYKDEFATCEKALNHAYAHVQFLVKHGVPNLPTEIANTPAPQLPGFDTVAFEMVQTSSPGLEAVTSGRWQGLTLYQLHYRARVTMRKSGSQSSFDHPGVTLAQNFDVTYIPLFNFAIFYDPIMEIAPGPRMTVNGRVHCNGDAYVQSNSGLDFLENVTVAGDIYHGRHPDSGKSNSNGDVSFTDGSSQRSMSRSDGDGWLDSRDGDWATASLNRWDEHVRDASHGTSPLGLPIPPVADPHSIIERSIAPGSPGYVPAVEQEKLENKAGLIIEADSSGNITGRTGAGASVDLSYHIDASGDVVPGPHPTLPAQTKYVAEMKQFYDSRESSWVSAVEVDMGNLKEYHQIVPSNGILFVSNEDQGGNMGAVRLTNGAELPQPSTATGFSVASDDPMYVQGDYNTIDQTLAMVAGDAITILSNAWDDANSTNYGDRNAQATEANAVFMNGIVPSANNNYSGGVENYFRFLEKWNGRDFTFSGSIIQLWESEKATGRWSYGNPVYTAPGRPWAWDTALGGIDGPPGAPRVVEIWRGQWEISEAF